MLKAQSIDNKNLKLLIKLGEAYLQSETETDDTATDEAINFLSQALLLDENNYDALIGLGKGFEKKQEFEKAIQFTQKATD